MKDNIKEAFELHEMARIGSIGKNANDCSFDIIVYTEDGGMIPHFHILDHETQSEKFHSCVRIDSPKYFTYGGKYKDKLNSHMKKNLIEFFNKKNSSYSKTSNWSILS